MIYHSLSEIDFSLDSLPVLPSPNQVLLTTPAHFDVQYVINPHMKGNEGSIDRVIARNQWDTLLSAYESLDILTHVLEGGKDLCDMVFCANQTLPYCLPDGDRGVILSQMFAEQRRKEVSHYATFFEQHGYSVIPDLSDGDLFFEGMGDAIWHPERFLLWGGYGIRTSKEAYESISQRLGVHVLLLSLSDDAFYHLDTCFCALDQETVLIYPGAFDEEGLELIYHLFPIVLEAPEKEARSLFACNAHCPDGSNVLIQQGCIQTNNLLREAGFVPIEVETGEFLKAGGSVFCMKLMMW